MKERLSLGIRSLLASYAGILFGSNIWIGGALLMLTLINPNVGISGFITVFSAYLFSRLLGKSDSFLHLDYHIYNPLLVGLSLGTLFRIGPVSIFFLISMGILTFLVTTCMAFFFSTYFKLPILSLPFVICSFISHLAAYRYSRLFVEQLYVSPTMPYQDSLPSFLSGFFTSMGAIFCLPNVLTGIGIFIILTSFSRILSLLAIAGYYSGIISITILTGSYVQAFANPNSFNYILIATAIGGVFLIPSLKSYIMAILAVIISVPVIEASQIFWERFGIPVFALPFNLIALITIYALGVTGSKIMTIAYKGSPEKTLDNHITTTSRFPLRIRPINTPFAGVWTVWQSFDGPWTHKGLWKYALDFVITDEHGETYKNKGCYLEDYYAFKKPILSPVLGEVTSIVSNIPDNLPGKVNEASNWGNYIIIYDYRGFYIQISHFSPYTIKLNIGDKVVIGQLLGLCGNSGYSPQPHMHLQAQLEHKVGSATVPFSLSSWVGKSKTWHNGGVPDKEELVTGVIASKALSEAFEFLIGSELEFEYFVNDTQFSDLKIQVCMAQDTTRYLTDGKGIIYVGQHENSFCCWRLDGLASSPLLYMFASLARIPLSFETGLEWSDNLPLKIIENPWKRELFQFLSSFNHNLLQTIVKYKAISNRVIVGKISLGSYSADTRLELDTSMQIKQINYNSHNKRILLRRKL